jgi:tRNA pseudouridine13 synthase
MQSSDTTSPVFAAAKFLPKVYPSLALSARFRSEPADFMVDETLGFTPSGEGEHWLVHIEKIGQNTHWVAEQLAQFCGLDPSAVGFCGRKDRHAITRQWFSLYDPHQTNIQWESLAIEGVELLEVHRHSRKLRLGGHQSNGFNIRLRDLCVKEEPISQEDQSKLETEIHRRLGAGVPNYFGEQRFGRGNSNLIAAQQWLEGGRKPHRKRRSMVYSAARSYLFNLLLATRVQQGNWKALVAGDVVENTFPTGPLWGRGRPAVSEVSRELEISAFVGLDEWCRGLEYCGLKQERRSLVLLPMNLELQWLDKDLQISFSLPVGTFATAVLTEIAELVSPE